MRDYDYFKETLLNLHNNLSVDNLYNSESYTNHRHKYELTEKEVLYIFQRKVYREIIKSAAFQRLKKIHFLGSIDYTINKKGPKPNKRHTRYQHSIGVAILALQYSREKNLSESDEIMCVVSALLHDIGHAPLSHSLESVFKEECGIGHHISGENIIKGDVEIGKSLHKILSNWSINPFEIMLIISGVGKSPYREIFSYSINIDTIEAIMRSTTYIYKSHLYYSPSIILSALLRKKNNYTSILDKFWHLKNEVYSELINSKLGVIADYICQKYMVDNVNKFKESYYYGTETQLKEDHQLLFDSLEMITRCPEFELLPDVDQFQYIKRKFFVDKDIKLDPESLSSLNHRYKQKKYQHIYKINKRGEHSEFDIQGYRKNNILF